jgi:integrase
MSENKNRKRRGRDEGSIYKNAQGIWTASISLGYDENGRRVRPIVYGATKREVQDKLDELRQNASKGIPDPGKLTVGAYLKQWAMTVKAKVQPNTWVPYDRHVRLHLVPRIGYLLLSKLSPVHLQQLYEKMTEDGVSAALQRKIGTTLGTALRAAIPLKLISSNPVPEIRKPKAPDPELQVYTAEQVSQFLRAAKKDRLYALYVLALDSGMRQGELFALDWPDVDFKAGSVHVQRSLEEIDGILRIKEVKTKKGRRRIELSQVTLNALNEHRQRMLIEGHDVKAGPVFVATEGGRLRKSHVVQRSYEPIIEAAGLPRIAFKELRHTCATLLLLADVNPKIVSERLGHSKIQITLDTYSHVLPTMQKKATEQLNKILSQKAKKSANP